MSNANSFLAAELLETMFAFRSLWRIRVLFSQKHFEVLNHCCHHSISFDMFKGSSTEERKAHVVSQWDAGSNYRLTWSYIAPGHSSAGGCASMEGRLSSFIALLLLHGLSHSLDMIK